MTDDKDKLDTQTIPLSAVRRMVAVALACGLIGGLIGGALVSGRTINQANTSATQKLTLQENSAVIDVVKKVSPSVVSITSESTSYSFFGPQTVQGAGTGIIVTGDGLIVTNKHVVADASATYTVHTSDGKQYSAKVVSTDPLNDIAFVRVSASGLTPATFGDSGSLQVGQNVVAIGDALGQFQNTATEGIISGFGRQITAGDQSGSAGENLTNLIQTDAAINPGNSGGPLIDLAGNVIGMNTAVAGSAQGIGFSIPSNEIKPDIQSVEAKGQVVRPYLGVSYVDVTPEFASANKLSVNYGAYLAGNGQTPAVISGSPADKAGLKDGDIIIKVDGQQLDDTHPLTTLIGQHNVGDNVSLTIVRGGKQQNLTVTLEQAPTSLGQ